MVIMNPGLEILGPMGYKPVEYTERPEITTPGNDLREVYTEEADRIRVGWEEYTSVPEPQPDPEQLREMAYRAEADQYLMAYEGYLAEGKILEADEQKALYLAKKAEIRSDSRISNLSVELSKYHKYMKRLINKLIGWLNAIAKDKYQHFAVGAVIASAALIVAVPLGAWWRWLPQLVSIIAVLTAAVVKERKIDPKADMQDILWTLAGGAVGWVVFIVFTLTAR